MDVWALTKERSFSDLNFGKFSFSKFILSNLSFSKFSLSGSFCEGCLFQECGRGELERELGGTMGAGLGEPGRATISSLHGDTKAENPQRKASLGNKS